MIEKFLGFLLAVLVGSSIVETFELEAIVANTRLPASQLANKVGYDGDDSIYVWAGGMAGFNRDINIYKYSISEQTIESVGTTPDLVIYGSGCWMGNEHFVHIGGRSGDYENYASEIWNFGKTNPSNWTVVSNLPNGMIYTASVWDYDENVYIIGGAIEGSEYVNTISKYSSTSQTVEIVGVLPAALSFPSAIWDNTTGAVYIFGGIMAAVGTVNEILKFNPVDGTVVKLGTRLPEPNGDGCALLIGNEAYIFGGSDYPNNATTPILRFKPATNEIISVPVRNLPPTLRSAGCAYVEKENRIYIFGGVAVGGGYRYEIMYIDLDDRHIPTTSTTATTLAPTTTTTTTTPDSTTETTNEPSTRPPVDFSCPTEDGLHADPKNCRGFYNCASWHPYHFCCPLPLFYNPSIQRCDFQDMVECPNDPGLPCDSPPGKLIH